MFQKSFLNSLLLTALMAFALVGCGGGGGGSEVSVNDNPTTQTYSVGVTVSGLATGRQLTLLINDGNNLTLTTTGTAAFPNKIQQNASYSVTVGTQPSGQICTVSNATGTNVTADVNNVLVDCANIAVPDVATYLVSVTTTGLATGRQVTLLLNDSSNLTFTAVGKASFPTKIQQSASYSVTIKTQPSGQICTVSNATGTNVTADVNNVSVYCANIVTMDFGVNNQFQLNGNGGSATIQFSTGSNKNIWVYGQTNAYSLYGGSINNCLSTIISASCSNSLSSQNFTSISSLMPTNNSFMVIKGSNDQYFLVNFLNSTRKIDGDANDGVSFVWYSTDPTTLGSVSSTYGPSNRGYNELGNSTPLIFIKSGTLTLNFDLQNVLSLINSGGGAVISFSTGSTNDSYIYAAPSLVTSFNSFNTDCSVSMAILNCQINLANYIFSSNPNDITTGNYALVWGTNNQYFLIQFTNPQRTIDGDSINGLTLTWYSTSNTTTISTSK